MPEIETIKLLPNGLKVDMFMLMFLMLFIILLVKALMEYECL